MKTTKTQRSAGGLDQRLNADPRTASELVNMRINDEGNGWIRDRGWEPYNPSAGYARINASDTQPIYSLYVWTRNQGAETYPLYEFSGNLVYEHGIDDGSGQTYPVRQYLDSGRTEPKASDPGTQFIPYGPWLIILNGHDQPLKFRGDKRVTPYGWQKRPAPPDVFQPDPTYYNTTGTTRNASNTTALIVSIPRGLGLSSAATDGSQQNRYLYRVAWVSESGSISPLSGSASASWSFDHASEQHRYCPVLRNIPTGPRGTVARIIYRTKNLINLDTQGESTYYFHSIINDNASSDFTDIINDAELITEAPPASIILPTSVKFGAVFDSRVWLSGGDGLETRIIYSSSSAPETFESLGYIETGGRSGGAITALISHYDALLVFRERSIEVVLYSMDGTGYRVSTISADVGTTATNTITVIPGKGLLFLSYDGVYSITGSGESMQMKRISDPISEEVHRINHAALPRASAAWSPREREWWCHYPADGASKCNRGIVFHVEHGLFSLRHSANQASSPGAFKFNAIASLPSGHFLLAPETKTESVSGTQFRLYNRGLQVWTNSGTQGIYNLATQVDGLIYTLGADTDAASITGIYASSWDDSGDASVKKSLRYVALECITRGHQPLTMFTGYDWRPQLTDAGTQYQAISSTVGGATEEAQLSPVITTLDDRSFIIGTDTYAAERIARVRWDTAGTARQYWRYKIAHSTEFSVIAYDLELAVKQRGTIHQRAGR